MPVYDFRCGSCGEQFEVTRPMASRVDEHCPSCGAVAKRLFTPVGVSFKGSGFHNTDYKSRPKEDAGSCPSAKPGSSACSSCPAAE